MSGAIDIRKLPAYQKGYRDGFLEGQRIGLEIARKTIESRTTSVVVLMEDGIPEGDEEE